MNRLNAIAIASCLGFFALAFAPNTKADEWNKKTILTVNESIAIPGKVLQPGKYVMKLMDSQSNRHIVQVFNEDETQLQTTVLAIPNYRLQPAGETAFGFWETPVGQAKALRSWFYPGDQFGHEFAYPKDMATQIAAANKESVPAIVNQTGTDMTTAEVKEIDPQGSEAELAQDRTQPREQAASTAQSEEQKTETSDAAQSSTTSSAQAETAESQAGTAATTSEGATATAQTDVGSTRTGTGATDQSAASTTSTAPSQTGTTAATTTGATDAPASTTPGSSDASQGASDQTQVASNAANLPDTASPLPLMGLAGLLSIGAAVSARALSKRA